MFRKITKLWQTYITYVHLLFNTKNKKKNKITITKNSFHSLSLSRYLLSLYTLALASPLSTRDQCAFVSFSFSLSSPFSFFSSGWSLLSCFVKNSAHNRNTLGRLSCSILIASSSSSNSLLFLL